MRKYFSLDGGNITDENGTIFADPALMVEPLIYGENYNMVQIKLVFFASLAAIERGNKPLTIPGVPGQFVIDTAEYYKDIAELPAAPLGLGDLINNIVEKETAKYLQRLKVTGTLSPEIVISTNTPGIGY